MPEFSCAVADIEKISCDGQSGIAAIFYTKSTEIDFEGTTISGRTVSAWAMESAGTWGEISAERENARVDFLFNEDNGFFEVTATGLVIRGQQEARTTALENMKQCCDLIIQVHFENGVTRVFGQDYKDGSWVEPVKGCHVNRWLATSGAFGTADDKVRDDFDILGRQSSPPVFSSVDIATMRGL